LSLKTPRFFGDDLYLSPADGRLMGYAFLGEGDVNHDAKHSHDEGLVQVHYD
jgi:hypothetical protein